MAKQKIDFILPAKIDSEDRMILFQQTISSLINNTDSKYINQIIVIDDGSLIDIPRYSYFKLYKPEKRLGVGGAKNYGIDIAKENAGDYLYIFDSDVFFCHGWADALVNAYEAYGNTYKIIGAGVHPYLQPRANEDNDLLTSHDAISGWSWLLTYDVFNEFGKLADNSLGTGKSEDWEYCQRIRNAGYLVGCLKDQKVAHTGMTNTEGLDIVGRLDNEKLSKQIAPKAVLL